MTIDDNFEKIARSSIQQVPARGSTEETIWREIEVSHLMEKYSKEYLLDKGMITLEEYEFFA